MSGCSGCSVRRDSGHSSGTAPAGTAPAQKTHRVLQNNSSLSVVGLYCIREQDRGL